MNPQGSGAFSPAHCSKRNRKPTTPSTKVNHTNNRDCSSATLQKRAPTPPPFQTEQSAAEKTVTHTTHRSSALPRPLISRLLQPSVPPLALARARHCAQQVCGNASSSFPHLLLHSRKFCKGRGPVQFDPVQSSLVYRGSERNLTGEGLLQSSVLHSSAGYVQSCAVETCESVKCCVGTLFRQGGGNWFGCYFCHV